MDNLVCDESKCVSTGRSHAYNGSHTCYGNKAIDAVFHPMMCADGYLPRVVMEADDDENNDSQDTLTYTVPTKTADGTTLNVTVDYFTCCPPSSPRAGGDPSSNNDSKTNSSASDDGRMDQQRRRHCSDPVWVNTTTIDSGEAADTDSTEQYSKGVCREKDHSRGRIYPRRMKPYRGDMIMNWTFVIPSKQDYLVCCDFDLSGTPNAVEKEQQPPFVESNNNTSAATATATATALGPTSQRDDFDFLEDTDCVPYLNQWYEVAESQNRLGRLSAVGCYVEPFVVPRPLLMDDNNSVVAPPTTTSTTGSGSTLHRYQCCRNGNALPPFVTTDRAFRINVYLPLALYLLAIALLATIVASLLVPFLVEWRHQRNRKRENEGKKKKKHSILRTTTWNSSRRSKPSTSASVDRSRSRNTAPKSSRAAAAAKPQYSTYNLYVMFLLLPDLAYSLCLLGFAVQTLRQHHNPDFYTMLVWPAGTRKRNYEEIHLLLPYVIGNTWMNGIISWRVVSLLRASKSVQRISQPKPVRVALEACGVYLLAGVSALVFHFLEPINFLACWLVFSGLVTPPCAYIVYAPFTVWRNSYLPPLDRLLTRSASQQRLRDRALRELALYFFRILCAYVLAVAPGIGFWMFGYVQVFRNTNQQNGSDWGMLALTVCLMLQMVVSCGFVLMKTDVRNYVWDLLSLSYLSSSGSSDAAAAAAAAAPPKKKNRWTPSSPTTPHGGTRNLKPGGIFSSHRRTNREPHNDDNISKPPPQYSTTTSRTTSQTSGVDSTAPRQPSATEVVDTTTTSRKTSRVDVDSTAPRQPSAAEADDTDGMDIEAEIVFDHDSGALRAAEGAEEDGNNDSNDDSDSIHDDSECLISSIFGVPQPSQSLRRRASNIGAVVER